MKFSKLVEQVSKRPIPPGVSRLIVEVMVSDEDGEDVEVCKCPSFALTSLMNCECRFLSLLSVSDVVEDVFLVKCNTFQLYLNETALLRLRRESLVHVLYGSRFLKMAQRKLSIHPTSSTHNKSFRFLLFVVFLLGPLPVLFGCGSLTGIRWRIWRILDLSSHLHVPLPSLLENGPERPRI
jgi:hypothetical protein